jgi:hypothetical protein
MKIMIRKAVLGVALVANLALSSPAAESPKKEEIGGSLHGYSTT